MCNYIMFKSCTGFEIQLKDFTSTKKNPRIIQGNQGIQVLVTNLHFPPCWDTVGTQK